MKNEPEVEVLPQTHAIELMERASIDVQIATARRYPRQLVKVKEQITELATMDLETAQACFYVLPRGGKTIMGPSVRLAEIAVSCYQHIRAGARVIDNDGKSITAQGVCHDLQNNVCIVMETKRRITKKDGRTFDDDMQIVAGNAAAAIAFRNAVFKVIPGALTKPAYDAARKVAIGDAKTLKDRRQKCAEAFAKMGIDAERLCALVGKLSLEEIGLEDLETLLGAYNSIREGSSSIDEIFSESDQARAGAMKAAQRQKMADWLVKTEGMAMDEALKEAEARLSETPEARADRLEKEHAEKQQAESDCPTYATWDAAKKANDGDEYAADLGMRVKIGKKLFTRASFESTWEESAK